MKSLNLNSTTTVVVMILTFAVSLVACSPKIYVIDNQTVLEEEAAGSWPQFEKQVLDRAKAKGPTPLSQVPPNKTRTRLYNVLNGEMPIVTAAAPPSPAPAAPSATSSANSGQRPTVPNRQSTAGVTR